jgi:hypothetical protein
LMNGGRGHAAAIGITAQGSAHEDNDVVLE